MKALSVSAAILALISSTFNCGAFTIQIGDNDGYGLGIADNGSSGASGFPGPSYDGRSLAEQSATNGAQFTDVYSALFPGAGPNPSTIGTVTFALTGLMLTGVLTIDMADFQASTWGQFSVSLNGVNKPGYFNFEDGFTNTRVRSFTLSAAEIANANAAGALTLTMNRSGSGDYVAFDYFKLDGDYASTAVPDAGGTFALLAFGVGGVVALQRKLRVA